MHFLLSDSEIQKQAPLYISPSDYRPPVEYNYKTVT